MRKDEETVSRDQFFNDIMEGFKESSAFARGQKNLRVTLVRKSGVTTMTLDDVLRFMSGVRTLEDCKRAWDVQAKWLREHPEDEVVIDEGEALYMHEEALKQITALKQTQPVT